MKRLIVLALPLLLALPCLAQKQLYLDEIRKAVEKGWNINPAVIEQWKKTTKSNVLWGYDAPAHPVYLASTLAFLYEQSHDLSYAKKAAALLASYGDLRSVLPAGYDTTRVEYAEGVPAIANFFFMAPYIRAYLRIRESGVMDAKTKLKIEKDLAGSADFIFHMPEWGAHNRAMLRAEALLYASLAMPSHPHAARWRQMAGVLAGDNVGHWEIEDASIYHPVWLLSLFSYAEAAQRPDVYGSPMTRFVLDYFTRLIAPSGTVPDFGDAQWNAASGALRFVAIFEKGAAVCRSPEMKWAARSILNTVKASADTIGVADAYSLTDAYRWADELRAPVRPSGGSQEVLDDMVGKKIVFRNGWDSTSTYMLLNYRDEGDGGWLGREYLRQTLSVEEEKMHHGHADENSIVLLMDKGSVLLHDAGYRDGLPSGRYGAWRQDYFHNRVIARKNKRDRSQPLLEFIRNSGAYRAVQTKKIDFLNLHAVDMSRTRVTDENLGYHWDRVITYVRDQDCFVVVDGIKALRSDYFTFANLWHAQKILARGEHYYDIATDSVPGFHFPTGRSLLVYFPDAYAKQDSTEPISRHGQTEHAVYQTISSQYKSGDFEVFVTVLALHDRTVNPAQIVSRFRLLPTSAPYRSVALQIRNGADQSVVFVKLDLEMEVARENVRPRYLYELGKVRFGDFETDAHFLYAAVGPRSIAYSAAVVLKVVHRGVALMAALPNTHSLQLDGGPDNHVGYSKWRYWEDTVPLH